MYLCTTYTFIPSWVAFIVNVMGFQYSEQGNDHSYDYDDPMALPCLTQDPIFCPYPTDFYVPLCAASYDYDLHRKKRINAYCCRCCFACIAAVESGWLFCDDYDDSQQYRWPYLHISSIFSVIKSTDFIFFQTKWTIYSRLYLFTSPYLSV